MRFEVNERINSYGEIIKPVDIDEVSNVVQEKATQRFGFLLDRLQ